MKRWERWTFNALNVVVGMTGIIYFSMKYGLVTDDPFAVVNHPWQPLMLSLHVVAAPVLILLFGIVLRSHILKKLGSKHQPDRRTGWMSLLSFVAMALSGYLLQVASSAVWLNTLIVVHLVTSGVFLVGYVAHLVIGWRLVKTSRAVAESEAGVQTTAHLPL